MRFDEVRQEPDGQIRLRREGTWYTLLAVDLGSKPDTTAWALTPDQAETVYDFRTLVGQLDPDVHYAIVAESSALETSKSRRYRQESIRLAISDGHLLLRTSGRYTANQRSCGDLPKRDPANLKAVRSARSEQWIADHGGNEHVADALLIFQIHSRLLLADPSFDIPEFYTEVRGGSDWIARHRWANLVSVMVRDTGLQDDLQRIAIASLGGPRDLPDWTVRCLATTGRSLCGAIPEIAIAAWEARNREEFTRLLGLNRNGWACKLRANTMQFGMSYALKRGANPQQFTKACRWAYHQLKADPEFPARMTALIAEHDPDLLEQRPRLKPRRPLPKPCFSN